MTNPDLTIEQYNQMTAEEKRDIHNTIAIYGVLYMLAHQVEVSQEQGNEIVNKVISALGLNPEEVNNQVFGPPVNLTDATVVPIVPNVIIELMSNMSRTDR